MNTIAKAADSPDAERAAPRPSRRRTAKHGRIVHMRKLMMSSGALALLATLGATPALADNLTLYCGADETWCQLMAKDLEAETGITVDMTRKSAGEIYAQVQAESENPKGDIWWAGTG